MQKRTIGILEVLIAIVIAGAAIHFSADVAAFRAYSYAGVFIISLLSAATIFMPAPGWAVVVAMSPSLDPLALGLVAGVGSAIGELTGYIAGSGIRYLLNERLRGLETLKDTIKKHDVLAIFALAAIPNPFFDAAGLVSGGLRIPWWRFLLACATGRVARYVLLALSGAFILDLVA